MESTSEAADPQLIDKRATVYAGLPREFRGFFTACLRQEDKGFSSTRKAVLLGLGGEDEEEVHHLTRMHGGPQIR